MLASNIHEHEKFIKKRIKLLKKLEKSLAVFEKNLINELERLGFSDLNVFIDYTEDLKVLVRFGEEMSALALDTMFDIIDRCRRKSFGALTTIWINRQNSEISIDLWERE